VKIRIDQKGLAEAAAWAARLAPARPTQPAYAALRLHARYDEIVVSGTDGETTVHTTVPADVEHPGVAVVGAKLLAGVAAGLPAGDVELALAEQRLAVAARGSSFTLATLPVADYPTLHAMPERSGTVAGDLLAAAVADIAHLTDSHVEALPGLSGIRITTDGDRLTLTATDRYRVGYRTVPWQPAAGHADGTTVVLGAALAQIAKGATGGNVALALPGADGHLAGIAAGARTTVTRVIDPAIYPNVDRVIPKACRAEVEIGAEELLAAVRRVALVADTAPLRLRFTVDRLTLAAADGDIAAGTTDVDCRMEGPGEVRIAFDPRYLIDGLTALSGTVRLWLNGPRTPVMFTAEDDETRRYLAVPKRDTWAEG
jgi:DNA polymerase-3 subunit beta